MYLTDLLLLKLSSLSTVTKRLLANRGSIRCRDATNVYTVI